MAELQEENEIFFSKNQTLEIPLTPIVEKSSRGKQLFRFIYRQLNNLTTLRSDREALFEERLESLEPSPNEV